MKIWNAPQLEELDVSMTMGGGGKIYTEATVAANYANKVITKYQLPEHWGMAENDGTPYPHVS